VVLGRGVVNDSTFATAFGDFIALTQERVEAFGRKHDLSAPSPRLSIVVGPRYMRVEKRTESGAVLEVWAFVERRTGDIYGMARGRRNQAPSGNIFSGDPMRHVDHEGPYLP
jgi:hypothetical protein